MLQPGLPYWLEKFLKTNFLKIELILVLLSTGGALVSITDLTLISMTTLACIYFLSGFFKTTSNPWFDKLMGRALPISWAVIVMGILFWFFKFEGYDQQLLIGMTAGIVMMVLMLVEAIIKSVFQRTEQMIRTATLCGTTIIIPGL